jgi:hypothetical protein
MSLLGVVDNEFRLSCLAFVHKAYKTSPSLVLGSAERRCTRITLVPTRLQVLPPSLATFRTQNAVTELSKTLIVALNI